MTFRAHKDSVVARLGRLFDPAKGALSLGNVLETLRQHSTHQPSPLMIDLGAIKASEIDSEVKEVLAENPAVSRLLTIRNQYLAHRDWRHVATGSFSSLPELSRDDIESLIKRAAAIVNKYCHLCGRPFVSPSRPGADDYRDVLAAIRSSLERSKSAWPS